MSWPVLRAAIGRLFSSTEPELSLQFTGGEPLLAFPLIRQAVLCAEKVCPKGRNVGFDLVTNGTLLGPNEITFLADHGFDLQLSFDGLQAAQDLRSKGTSRRLDRLLDHLQVEQPQLFGERLRIAVTLSIPGIPYLADSVEYLLEKGAPEIALSPAMGQRLPWRLADIRALKREFRRIFESSVRLYENTGRVPFMAFRKEQSDSTHRGRGQLICNAPEGRTVTVDVDGQVYGCPTLAESYQTFPDTPLRRRLMAMRLGDIRDPALPKRLKALPAAARAAGIFCRKETKYSSYGRCADCRFFATCLVCPMSVARDPDHADPNRLPDFLCAFNQVVLKYRERFPRQPTAQEILRGKAPVPKLVRDLMQAFGHTPPSATGGKRSSPPA
jgi:sulfatase maturation enzyme AslB (radical SAM superfamily)